MIHIVINNGTYETVSGMPVAVSQIDLVAIAGACGYPDAVCADSFDALDAALGEAENKNELPMIEVKRSIGAHSDQGSPQQ